MLTDSQDYQLFFKEYMVSCSETISPERLQASVAAVRTM